MSYSYGISIQLYTVYLITFYFCIHCWNHFQGSLKTKFQIEVQVEVVENAKASLPSSSSLLLKCQSFSVSFQSRFQTSSSGSFARGSSRLSLANVGFDLRTSLSASEWAALNSEAVLVTTRNSVHFKKQNLNYD